MLTINEIKESINDIVAKYPIKKVSLFGSYADKTANNDSDIDLLVEFISSDIRKRNTQFKTGIKQDYKG